MREQSSKMVAKPYAFSGEGNGKPLQYSCLENPHAQRSLVGYNPWGQKELDVIE